MLIRSVLCLSALVIASSCAKDDALTAAPVEATLTSVASPASPVSPVSPASPAGEATCGQVGQVGQPEAGEATCGEMKAQCGGHGGHGGHRSSGGPSGHAHGTVAAAFDAAPAAGEKALCLVMNREFVVDDRTVTSVYDGKTYAFCCDGCKQAFDENPAKFAALAPTASAPKRL